MVAEQDDEVVVVYFDAAKNKMKSHLLVVGRYVTTQVYSTRGLFQRMRQAWQLRGAIEEKPFADNRYLIEFKHEGDYNHVLKGGPWAYQNYPMLVKAYDGHAPVAEMSLNMMPIWVRILDLPLALMNEEWGREITNKQLGQFKEVAKDNKNKMWDNTFRIRIEHDVSRPIRRWVKVQDSKSRELLRNDVKYERLPNFCFYCGVVGHVERACMLPEEENMVRYCVEQRASPYKPSEHRSYYLPAEPANVKRHVKLYSTSSSGWKCPVQSESEGNMLQGPGTDAGAHEEGYEEEETVSTPRLEVLDMAEAVEKLTVGDKETTNGNACVTDLQVTQAVQAIKNKPRWVRRVQKEQNKQAARCGKAGSLRV
ncbi:hypothetical protein ACQ4PT_015144 [Festuca glaucescens]